MHVKETEKMLVECFSRGKSGTVTYKARGHVRNQTFHGLSVHSPMYLSHGRCDNLDERSVQIACQRPRSSVLPVPGGHRAKRLWRFDPHAQEQVRGCQWELDSLAQLTDLLVEATDARAQVTLPGSSLSIL